jgi:MFS family permease
MNKNYKWFMLAMLSCAFFFHQADRALFGLLTIPIQKELALSDVQIGWINTVLSWTLAAMTTLAGFVGDRFNRKWIITLSLMFWSLMTVCMGFVGDWKIFGIGISAFACVMFFRSIATGGGESFYAPSAYALIAAHHKESRSVALSIHQAALYIGLMCSGVIVAWSLDWLGSWRNVFILFGVAGFLLGVFFVFALKETPDGAKVPVKQTDPAAKSMLKEGLKAYFCNPSALCATAGFIAIVFVNNAYLFWAPKFMAEKFAVDVGEAGKSSMLWHHLFAFGAILLGGIVTDKFVGKMPRFRLGFQIIALLCGAPALVMLGFSSSATMMVAMMSVYGIFRGFFEVNTHASLFDVVDPAYRSTAVGLLNMLAFFFGGLSGVVMGALSEKWGVRGFETGFALMGGTYAVAALLMMVSFFFTFEKNRVKEG